MIDADDMPLSLPEQQRYACAFAERAVDQYLRIMTDRKRADLLEPKPMTSFSLAPRIGI